MTIHNMLNSAATDIRAMEIKIQTLEQQVEATERDNVRLRESLAASDTARVHAQADLIHYQNIFKASACVEAMKMCQKFFEVTHAGMREEAEAAIQRMVEEKVEKDREESASEIGSYKHFQPESPELVLEDEPASTASPSVPQDGTIVQAPEGLSNIQKKYFYRNSPLRQLPPNYRDRPIFCFTDGRWIENKTDETSFEIPRFLKPGPREPREDLRGGVSKAILGMWGG